MVLDPFGGVGSTLISAVKNNRIGITIDTEIEYSKVAQDRLDKLINGTLKMRPMTKKIYKPTEKDSVARVPKEWKGKGAY